MSERYYSAKALAGLPGMPGTERGVLRKAIRESWAFRKRQGRGGGREYRESDLPKLTQRALAARRKIQAAQEAHQKAGQSLPKSFYIMIDGDVFEVLQL